MSGVLSTSVSSLQQLLSIALQAEREAIRRYTELNQLMHSEQNASAAALFSRLIREEEEHESLLLEWMHSIGLTEQANVGPVRWQDPGLTNTYRDQATDPVYSTPYKALAFAVHNEEIAFRFYTHVAAISSDADIKKHAEILAREELGHAALLRAERRKAYHDALQQGTLPTLHPQLIHTDYDLLHLAIQFESKLLDRINTATQPSDQTNSIRMLIQQSQDTHSQSLSLLNATDSPELSSQLKQVLDEFDSYLDQSEADSASSDRLLSQLLRYLDQAFTFYDAMVLSTSDEKIMLLAQQLSEFTLDCIDIIRQEE